MKHKMHQKMRNKRHQKKEDLPVIKKENKDDHTEKKRDDNKKKRPTICLKEIKWLNQLTILLNEAKRTHCIKDSKRQPPVPNIKEANWTNRLKKGYGFNDWVGLILNLFLIKKSINLILYLS